MTRSKDCFVSVHALVPQQHYESPVAHAPQFALVVAGIKRFQVLELPVPTVQIVE